MLTCSCYDDDDPDWWYMQPDDFTVFNRSRRQRCCSCKTLIDIGSLTVEFDRWRHPVSDVEYNIYGDGGEIQIAPWFMCEWCGEMFLNLRALGYCHWLGSSIKKSMAEYWELTGFIPSLETVL